MKKTNRVAVIVGRFQTPKLHDGHRFLIDAAKSECQELMIIVGVSGGAASRIDPMDFDTRALMLSAHYPMAKIVQYTDHSVDEVWSKKLDELIEKTFPHHEAVLFGSRDSFMPHYHGKNRLQEIKPKIQASATALRNEVGTKPIDSKDFRAGIIYAATKQTYPTSYQTVDIVIRHSTQPKVLVGRKVGEEGWRFPGGFVDPTDLGLEYAAKREAKEELGDIEIDDLKYVCSTRINDHRYRKSEHKIMTAFFSGTYIYGPIKAGDDLDEVRWQDIDGLVECLLDAHKPLGTAYLKTIA